LRIFDPERRFNEILSGRLDRLEAEDAEEKEAEDADPETVQLRARYAKYKEEKAEEWKRLNGNREKTYHESWAELTLSQYVYCIRGQGTPEERYQFKKEHRYWHDSYVEGSFDGCNFECIPECRYYADKGTIEDEESIAEFERMKERFPPSCLLSVRLKSLCDECRL
jgi:hypothetical protein